MKVLIVNTTLNVGSTGRIAEQIAIKATESGCECYMAHGGRYIGNSKFTSIQVSSRLDNYFHAFKGEYLGLHGLGSTSSTRKFIDIIKTINPDVIHLHNIHGYYLNYKVLFNFLITSHIPVIWTLHDCWAFTGHCTHFENVGCEKWKVGCYNCPLMMAQYKSRLIDRSKKNYSLKKNLYGKLSNITIVPVSRWLGNLVSQSILGRFPIKVIQNGIDLDVFKHVENRIRYNYNIDDNSFIVLGVLGSGFGAEKGKKEFIELARHSEYKVILVGLTKDDAKGLPDNIIKIGRTNSQIELAEFYSAADVMLNPTYNDTFPTTNIESIACGTPVVTYYTGGSPEIIDAKTGFLIEKGDMKGLISAIEEIRRKGKASYSKACRERAEKYFNKEDRYVDYIELYKDCVLNSSH